MRRFSSTVFAIMIFTFVGAPSFAQESLTGDFLVAPSIFYNSGIRTKTSKDEKSYLVGELKLAYQVHPDIFLGATYQREQEDSKTSGYSAASLNNATTAVRESLGASVGYVTTTYHVLFTYFFDSKWNVNSKTTTGSNKYNYTGNGMQLDLGYKIPIWGIYFGPQLSYKMFTYTKLKTDGGEATSLSPKLEDTSLDPSLVFVILF